MKKMTWFAVMLALGVVICSPLSVRAESEDAEESDELGWFGKMRVKMMAKTYGYDEATATKLLDILSEEKTQKKAVARQIKDVHAEIEDLLKKSPVPEADVASKLAALQAKKLEITGIENKTQDKVVALLGTVKAAEWVLAQRPMTEKMKGAVQKAAQKEGSGENKWPSPPPKKKTGTGY